MKVLIVGGTFTDSVDTIHRSGIVHKMYEHLLNTCALPTCIDVDVINGGLVSNIPSDFPIKKDADLTIWMPNIPNEEDKSYPVKKQGSVLICSKVMREGYTRADSVSRIFKMHGNAVIEIHKDEKTGMAKFTLVDALGNVWYDGSDIPILMTSIMAFVAFTKSAKRINTSRANEHFILTKKYFEDNKANLEVLLDVNRKLQHHIQTSCGNRFFGNVSTRCQKLFPTIRAKISNERNSVMTKNMFVSPRNSNKESLTPEDMVLYLGNTDSYCGENKPSVDSPAQSRLYDKMNNINFMIHGHAEIKHRDAAHTTHYKLCGDINEVDEILNVVDRNSKSFIVNLLGHGFLIGAETGEGLNSLVDKIIKEGEFKITNQ